MVRKKSSNESDIVHGLHAVSSVLRHRSDRVIELWVNQKRTDSRVEEILEISRVRNIPVHYLNREEMDERMPDANHQGIAAVCSSISAGNESDLQKILDGLNEVPFLLILDGVTDPHNLGACLRSADAAGVHAVIAPKDRAASLTPVARKAASGAAETMPFIMVTNLARTMRKLKKDGIWLMGLCGEASEDIYHTDLKGPLAMVLGAEGKGLRRLTREECDCLIKIPMVGGVESLNVSVAAGVCLFDAVRQRSN